MFGTLQGHADWPKAISAGQTRGHPVSTAPIPSPKTRIPTVQAVAEFAGTSGDGPQIWFRVPPKSRPITRAQLTPGMEGDDASEPSVLPVAASCLRVRVTSNRVGSHLTIWALRGPFVRKLCSKCRLFRLSLSLKRLARQVRALASIPGQSGQPSRAAEHGRAAAEAERDARCQPPRHQDPSACSTPALPLSLPLDVMRFSGWRAVAGRAGAASSSRPSPTPPTPPTPSPSTRPSRPSRIANVRSLPPRCPCPTSSSLPESVSPGQVRRQVIELRVFLPDGPPLKFPLQGGRRASVARLTQLVVQELGLPADAAAEAFALWMASPLLGCPLLLCSRRRR